MNDIFQVIGSGKMKIYLDVCCYNRPFDDQDQDRVRLEAEAVKTIVRRISQGRWKGVTSSVVDFEIARMSDSDRLFEVVLMVSEMTEKVILTEGERSRARRLEQLGFKGTDAAHIVCAEKAKAELLLTTDDAFLRTAKRHSSTLAVRVENPYSWLKQEVLG